MYNSVMVFTFSLLDQKLLFWANLVQKIKIVSLSWNLVPRLIRICRILWSCFTGNTLLFKFGRKNKNFQFKQKFSVLDRKHPLRANLVQQIKIVSLSWNLVSIYINSNMRISMVVFTFSVLYRKHFFLLPLRPYGNRDLEIGSSRQHGFFIMFTF